MGLFDSLVDLTGDVVKIALAPVEIIVEVACAAVEPIAEVTEDLVEDIKDIRR